MSFNRNRGKPPPPPIGQRGGGPPVSSKERDILSKQRRVASQLAAATTITTADSRNNNGTDGTTIKRVKPPPPPSKNASPARGRSLGSLLQTSKSSGGTGNNNRSTAVHKPQHRPQLPQQQRKDGKSQSTAISLDDDDDNDDNDPSIKSKSKYFIPVVRETPPPRLPPPPYSSHKSSSSSSSNNNNNNKLLKSSKPAPPKHVRPSRRGVSQLKKDAPMTADMALAASKSRLGIEASSSSSTTFKTSGTTSNTSNTNDRRPNTINNNNKTTMQKKNNNKSEFSGTAGGGGGVISKFLSAKSINLNDLQSKTLQQEEDESLPSLISMENYFRNLREWDMLYDWNQEQVQLQKQQQRQQKQNNQRQTQKRKRGNSVESDDDEEDGQINDPTQKKGPSNDEKDDGKGLVIPSKFTSRKQYQQLWSKLCLSESRAQILSDAISDYRNLANNHEGNDGKKKGKGGPGNRSSVVPVLVKAHPKDVGSDADSLTVLTHGHAGKYPSGGSPSFMTNDIVVLMTKESCLSTASKGKLAMEVDNNNRHASRIHPDNKDAIRKLSMIGHVEYSRKTVDGLNLKISRRLWLKSSTTSGEIEMYLWNLGVNITGMREFSALCRVGSTPLLDHLLRPKKSANKNSSSNEDMKLGISKSHPENTKKDSDSINSIKMKRSIEKMGGSAALGEGFVNHVTKKFNPSQLEAISASAAEYGEGGFTLIKGPPGTGKTTTLTALLNALHIRQMYTYYEKVREIIESTNSAGLKKEAVTKASKAKPRLLVCAPSNNAIDNVIRKIMEESFVDGRQSKYNPSIVRVGRRQGAEVKDVSMDTKVESLISETHDLKKLEQSIHAYRSELFRMLNDMNQLHQRIHTIKTASPWPLCKDWEIRIDIEDTGKVYFVNHKEQRTTFECPPPPEPDEIAMPQKSMPECRMYTSQLVKLIDRYNMTTSKLERCVMVQREADQISRGGRNANSQIQDLRQQLETHILDSTQIVFTTLGTAGCKALESAQSFEVVVIDEACQSIEPATLVALQLGSSHAILVGDPQQLPATIFNVSGRNSKFDRSLFQRLEEAGHDVHMLDTQYRMHPAISSFPRRIFYNALLKDGPNVKNSEYGNPAKAIIKPAFPSFKHFTIFDLDSSEKRDGTSMANAGEARFALHLYRTLTENNRNSLVAPRIAIITPYSQQIALIRRIFSQEIGPHFSDLVEINTVDAFQGRESNIVIFSCVRAAGSNGIGFLSDVRRMNVALTRAKHFLFVIARCKSIVVNPYWKDLVKHARDLNAVLKVPILKGNSFPALKNVKAPTNEKKKRKR